LCAQLSGLAGFVNSRAGEHGNGGGDESFLQRGHGNGFGDSDGGGSRNRRTSERSGRNGNGQSNRRGLHGVGREDDDESTCADGDATLGEEFAQPLDGTVHAFLRGLVADVESLRYLTGGLAFKVAEQQHIAILIAQLAERGVKMRGDVFPAGVGFGGKQFVHDNSLLFARLPADIGADGIGCEILCRAVQPAGQDWVMGELPGVLRQRHKHALSYVLRQMRIANHPQSGGIDEVNVTAHQLGKRQFRMACGINLQELLVGLRVHS